MTAFYLKLVAKPGFTIRNLRLVLKRLLRQHNLRCASIRETTEGRHG